MRTLCCIALLLTATACAGDLSNETEFVEFRRQPHCHLDVDVVEDIFVPQCASSICHGIPEDTSRDSAGELDLISDGVAERMISVESTQCAPELRVVPNQPDQSFLIMKLTGELPPGCGEPMPATGAPLSDDEIDCVRAWITEITGPIPPPSEDAGPPPPMEDGGME